MAHAEVTGRIAAPAAAVWEYVRWERAEVLEQAGFFTRVEYAERRAVPGAERTLHGPDGAAVRERLVAVEPAAHRYVYRLVDPGPLPLADYVGEVRVVPEGPARCRIVVASTFTPAGVTEAAWRARYEELEQALFAYIRARVEHPPTEALEDRNVTAVEPLVTPRAVKTALPVPPETAAAVRAAREAIRRVLHGQDRRLVVVVGPCSIHDPDAAVDYAERLRAATRPHEDALVVVMRTYFEKPRTTVGWKGLVNDPRLDGSCDVQEGLRLARRVLLEVTRVGVPCGSELLDPITPQYIADLLAWASIGARTTESQTHREMASGLSMPVGFKNGTDGSVQVAVDAMTSAGQPHTFLGIDVDGVTSTIRTRGNPDRHIVLRGGRAGSNHRRADVERAAALVTNQGIARPIMVDCSHGNSAKNPANQVTVARDVLADLTAGGPVMGLLLESHIVGGRQDWQPHTPLRYGQSITDACLGWEETAALLEEIAAAARGARDRAA